MRFLKRLAAKFAGPEALAAAGGTLTRAGVDALSADGASAPAGLNIDRGALPRLGGDASHRFSLTTLSELPVNPNPFAPAKLPPGIEHEPKTKFNPADHGLAMDDSPEGSFGNEDSDNPWGGDWGNFLNFNEGIGFFGYAYLTQLAQRPEYRKIVETLATEMTREWVELVYQGDEGGRTAATEKIKEIEEQWDKWKLKEVFRHALECDGFFGRGQIYIDLGNDDDDQELATILVLDRRKIKVNKVRGFKVIEPIWSYPNEYNTTNPLKKDFYKPSSWLVMNKRIHNSRLLTIVGRPVPDLLKPAYAFGGLSMSQMAKPYVDNWLRTRQSVSDLIHSFTIWGIKTQMGDVLQGGDSDQLILRAEMFNRTRDNRGLMMIQNGKEGEGEDFFNISVPLGTLDALQAQSQEQLASISSIPLVKLLGTTPSGLNASSDGEIRVFYDTINADQERLLRHPLEVVLKVTQLHLYGCIDDNIGFEFKELWQQDESEQALARKADSDIDVSYIDAGVLDPIEVRQKLASDKNSPYSSIDVQNVPDDPAMMEAMTDIASAAVEQPDVHAHMHAEGAMGGEEGPGGNAPQGMPGGFKAPQQQFKAKEGEHGQFGLKTHSQNAEGNADKQTEKTKSEVKSNTDNQQFKRRMRAGMKSSG